MKEHKKIEIFNPSIEELNKTHRDLVNRFTVGDSESSDYIFSSYIRKEAFDDQQTGDGVSYLVYNLMQDEEKEVVAYFTLLASSIPYISRVKESDGKYNDQQWGIPSVEISMFAVSEKYQDTFYNDKLIAAIVFESIISMIDDMSTSTLGIKAIYLHSVRKAEDFYSKCNMSKMEEYMQPFHRADNDLQGMYALIRKVDICYEE